MSSLRRLSWPLVATAAALALFAIPQAQANHIEDTNHGGFGHDNTIPDGYGTGNLCNVNDGCFIADDTNTGNGSTGLIGKHSGTSGGTSAPFGAGVYGLSNSQSGNAVAVYGTIAPSGQPGSSSAGVRGDAAGVGNASYDDAGVFGYNNGHGYGVRGLSDIGDGVFGNTNSTLSGVAGVAGTSTAAGTNGVYGSGPTGVYGTGNTGVYGTGNPGVQGNTGSTAADAVGVQGTISSSSPGGGSSGVWGQNLGTAGLGQGVLGSQAGSGVGVWGTTPLGVGVVGVHRGSSGTAPGVQGETSSTDPYAAGVLGRINPTNPAPSEAGVRGINNGTGVYGFGVYGSHAGMGYGVYGQSANGYGVVGESSNWAGYFFGNVYVTGTLSAAAKNFRIDDPLDPAHKVLQHASVESNQLSDVYSGNVTTNGKGFATVRLPSWFQALNRNFRYQLTSLSGLQEVAVAKEIARNQFTIQSQKPHSKVSWQVTGVRHDPYARAHPLRVIEPKPAAEQGRYLQPELYGQPDSKRIGARALLGGRQPSYRLPAGGR